MTVSSQCGGEHCESHSKSSCNTIVTSKTPCLTAFNFLQMDYQSLFLYTLICVVAFGWFLTRAS